MDIDINGITVIFPYKPYDIQVNYMRSVINSLQNKQDALLESPTGTGKTLSLLCSTLAWLENRKYQDLELIKNNPQLKEVIKDESQAYENENDNSKSKGGKGWKNENPIRIIYSSRTHSQLNQACSELKNSYYSFTPTVTIGSREQLCINPEVKNLESSAAKNQTCRQKVKSNTCKFHNNYERKVSDLSFSGSKVYDIEDLIKFGNENKACPYYLAKAKSDFNTSLVFMPYNYILDPNIRKTLKLNLENCVIIFDEGHNIERVCEDSMSTEIKSEWLALFINTFDTALQSLKLLDEGKYDGTNEKELSELNIHDIAQVKMVMCDLEVELDRMVKQSKGPNKSYHQTEEIFQIFDRVGLDYQKCGKISSLCEKLISYVMSSVTSYMNNSIISALTSICSFLEIVIPFASVRSADFSNFKTEFIKNYKLYSEIENEANSWNSKNSWSKKKTQNTWTVNLWCMSPSVAIKSLKSLGIYNMIITSGTLAPLESFECEMGNPFPIKLQNSHVISKNQLSIQLIFKDPNGNDLSGSYENRNDVKYYNGLGFTILELSRTIPKGMFIFFSSYSLINKCIEMWKNRQGVNLWTSISSLKRIYVEPRSKNEFSESIHSFKETVDNSNDGAIFMGVSRGKLSEGIDLGDDYCRAVIIVGLPYPARYDPKVVLKQKYLDENNSKINGIKWYMLQMKRALNQSIGRVVRHKNDYGSIIICDSRFKQLNDGLSRWIQAFLTGNTYSSMNADFKTKLRDIQNFYKNVEGSHMLSIERSAPPASKSTSGGLKSEICLTKAVLSNSDNLMESTFDSIKNSYMSTKTIQATPSKRSNGHLESDSIFDSLSYSNGSTKKRQNDQNLESNTEIFSGNNPRNSGVRSKVLFRDANYFKMHQMEESDQLNSSTLGDKSASRNDKMKLISHYFSRPKTEEQGNKNANSIPIINLDDHVENITVSSPTTSNRLHCQSTTTNFKTDVINLESEDILNLRNSIFLTEHNQSTFESIINEVKDSSVKSRQFIETLRIYGKKRNTTYLALRMNFILDSVSNDKRDCILKDLSLSVPERERRQFLRTCKVNTDS